MSAVIEASSTTVEGRLEAVGNTNYRIDIYANDSEDPSGYGEGQDFVGVVNITTNAEGWVFFSTMITSALDSGEFISATATDPNGNSSEFSKCIRVPSLGFTFELTDGWNLISLPVRSLEDSKNLIFPKASSPAFYYDRIYRTSSAIVPEFGYWIKSGGATTGFINGDEIKNDTIQLKAGWNIVGTISKPLPVSLIDVSPSAVAISQIYSYNKLVGDYLRTDTIFPGRGYWVKSSEVGELILNAVSTPGRQRPDLLVVEDSPPPPPKAASEQVTIIPAQFSLVQNYPNPFNPSTIIRYQLPVESWVKLRVYNSLGVEVTTLVDEMQDAGDRSVKWEAARLPSGMYVCKIEAGGFSDSKKMLLVR